MICVSHRSQCHSFADALQKSSSSCQHFARWTLDDTNLILFAAEIEVAVNCFTDVTDHKCDSMPAAPSKGPDSSSGFRSAKLPLHRDKDIGLIPYHGVFSVCMFASNPCGFSSGA